MSDDDGEALSNLGQRLLAGVTALWEAVKDQGRKIKDHDDHIDDIRARLSALEEQQSNLERQLHGARTSRGISEAKRRRAEAALAESQGKIADIQRVLH